MSQTKLCLFFMLCLCLYSCKPEKKAQLDIQVNVPKFNEQNAYDFIAKQVSFGPRYVGAEGHGKCKAWLVQEFKNNGAVVQEQAFEATAYDGTKLNGTNIIARYNPHVLERVLLAAHWDTRHIAEKDTTGKENEPILGADDGGSGVGVLLEIARLLKEYPIPMGVDIVLFDAEDYGSNKPGDTYSWGLGSQYWSKNIHEENYQVKYGILLDMVGSKNAQFPKEGLSQRLAAKPLNKIWSLAKKMGKEKYFTSFMNDGITDDHFFVMENTDIQMVDIVNMPKGMTFGHYHHTHEDNMDIIDKNTLKAVGQVVAAVIYKESNKKL